MKQERIEEVILEYVRKLVHPGVEADTRLVEAGLLDSFDAVEVIDFIEEQFDIRISPSDLAQDDFVSVASMAGFVARKRSSGEPPSEGAEASE